MTSYPSSDAVSLLSPEQIAHARKLAGRLIMIRFAGTVLDAEMAEFLRQHHIRAVCLFRQNMVDAEQLLALTTALREVMGPDALIAIDQEGGAVIRTTWVPQAPSAMNLGASDDPDLCFQIGAAVARNLRALGFNWNFAPVMDVNNNLQNPVIAERAFGDTPERVMRLSQAWMAGSLSEGVACCMKHFPGHGDTHVDSHLDLPTVDKSRSELDALELMPFAAAAAVAPAVMTAHIQYPQLDANYPATMSHAILTGILRDEWKYQGVVITDGMDMRAIADYYGVAPAAILALQAGADMVMTLGNQAMQLETLQALSEAIALQTVSDDLIQAKLQRISNLTSSYPCAYRAYEQEASDRELMERAWLAGLTEYAQVNVPAQGSLVRLVMRASAVSDGVSEAGVGVEKVQAMLASLYDVALTTYEDADQFAWDSLPQDGRFVILVSSVRKRYSDQVKQTWKPDLHLALWSPFHILDIDAPALVTYGFADPALNACHAYLSGQAQALGQLPFQI
jgi:beta-N-acetylhexosaminidase